MKRKLGKGSGLWAFIILLLIGLLVWGIIGGSQAQHIGITCDMGIGDKLCWKWHTNAVGQAQEFLEDVLG